MPERTDTHRLDWVDNADPVIQTMDGGGFRIFYRWRGRSGDWRVVYHSTIRDAIDLAMDLEGQGGGTEGEP